MDFIDQIKQFSNRIKGLKDSIQTEEATKTSIIMPFFSMLGYDVFDPQEFVPEYTADVGIKKGEKVDYAILKDGKPCILIEAKSISENLDKHNSQLFRYFGTTEAKFAILTNGIRYKFYTDLEQPNKMDSKPFLDVNILDIKENQVTELKKFSKSSFDVKKIFDTASNLKYSTQFKTVFANELQNPSDSFVNLFVSAVYDGKKTQSVIEKFRPILKSSLNQYITENMNEKIKSALNAQEETAETEEIEEDIKPKRNIVTTQDELEAYFIVKNILKDIVDIDDITFKDNESYMAILYKNKTTKWICRLYFNTSTKYITIPDADKKEKRISLNDLYEIEQYKQDLLDVLTRYL